MMQVYGVLYNEPHSCTYTYVMNSATIEKERRNHYNKRRLRFTWYFIMLSLLSVLSAFTQIRLCPINRFFQIQSWSVVYAAISVADFAAIPSVGRSGHLQYFCCSHCPSDHNTCGPLQSFQLGPCQAKAMSMLSHHATAAYVILGIITCLYSHSAFLGESPQVLLIYALHDHRVEVCAETKSVAVAISKIFWQQWR